MSNARWFLIGCLLAGSAVAAGAQTIKPGLWEISSKMAGGSVDMNMAMREAQKSIESMPPAQRKKMEEMMAKQGVSMGKPGGGFSAKVCMTQEMIDRNQVARQEGNCKQTSSQRSGNTLNFSVVCTDPPSTGEGQVIFNGSEAFTTKMAIHTTRQGKPETMKLESSGKFLSPDCGSIKPPVLPK